MNLIKYSKARLNSSQKIIGVMILIIILIIILLWGMYFSNSRSLIENKSIVQENKYDNLIKENEDKITVIKIVKKTITKIFKKNKFCGDGTCDDDEEEWCYLDCKWCGDSYCQEKENCTSCSKDCGNCVDENFCGNSICDNNKCYIGCTKDCGIIDCLNGICEPQIGENCLNSPSDCSCFFGESCSEGKCKGGYCGNKICNENENCKTCSGDCVCEVLKKCVEGRCKTYCGNGVCESDETKSSCPEDCGSKEYEYVNNPDENYPLIFVHGHSTYASGAVFSINGLNDFQEKLDSDEEYKNMGVILPNSNINSYEKGEWGRFSKAISVRTTYYIGILDSTGSFSRTDNAQRPINEYAERLGKAVDIVLHHTGKNKVVIVAHSMGGLVARAYIKNYNGDKKVDKLVLIGTPNHGYYKEDTYNYVVTRIINCKEIHPGAECEDMSPGSNFLRELNTLTNGNETFGETKYLTIAGDCCKANGELNDELIRISSVNLKGAENKIVKGKASSSKDPYTFHGYLVTPSKNPSVYDYTKEFLRG